MTTSSTETTEYLREDLLLADPDLAADDVTVETIRIDDGDAVLVANLYRPAASGAVPAAVVGGSLTSVKEMMGGNYARALARRGLIALSLDYSNYGESGGAPRQFEDPAQKLADLTAAVKWLSAREDVSGVGLLGVCTSGGTVMYGGAQSPGVGAVATVAGWFAEPALLPVAYGSADEVSKRRAAGDAARATYDRTGEVETILAYHDTDTTASHVGPMEYYMSEARGGGIAAYRNAFAVMGWGPWLDFDPVDQARRVNVPTLVIHSDHSAFPGQARKVYELLPGEKSLHWAEGPHFSFYDDPRRVAEAADAITAHFNAHLQ